MRYFGRSNKCRQRPPHSLASCVCSRCISQQSCATLAPETTYTLPVASPPSTPTPNDYPAKISRAMNARPSSRPPSPSYMMLILSSPTSSFCAQFWSKRAKSVTFHFVSYRPTCTKIRTLGWMDGWMDGWMEHYVEEFLKKNKEN